MISKAALQAEITQLKEEVEIGKRIVKALEDERQRLNALNANLTQSVNNLTQKLR